MLDPLEPMQKARYSDRHRFSQPMGKRRQKSPWGSLASLCSLINGLYLQWETLCKQYGSKWLRKRTKVSLSLPPHACMQALARTCAHIHIPHTYAHIPHRRHKLYGNSYQLRIRDFMSWVCCSNIHHRTIWFSMSLVEGAPSVGTWKGSQNKGR